MIGDTFVIDAVVHGYNLSPENQRGPASAELAAALYYGVHRGFSPRGQAQWVLDAQRFFHGHNPDLLAHALFAESQTDVGLYHGVPAYGMFTDGGSPLWVGKEIRTRYPGRMLLYGPISPWEPNAVEEVDRLVEEEGIVGIKLYPLDIVDGEIKSWRTDDPELIYPILERTRQGVSAALRFTRPSPLAAYRVTPSALPTSRVRRRPSPISPSRWCMAALPTSRRRP